MENSKRLSYKSVVALGFLVYFFSYAMRLDYAASIVEIVKDLKITKDMASFAVTGSFITYGLGQVICGFIGDKVSPTKMMSVAMLGTILVNIAVSFCSNIWIITVLWCINGVCQAMLWPPLTRFVSEQIGTEKYSNAITIVGLSASTGTIFVYLLVPFILKFAAWPYVFRTMSLFGIAIMLVWVYATRNVKLGKAQATVKSEKKDEKTISVWGLIVLAGLIPIFLAIAVQGFLRDGIQTWLPSLVNEQFGWDESSSVLGTAILPIFSMICVIIATALYNKIKNELKTAAIMFGISLIAAIPLLFTSLPIITIVCAALISASMHGVNHMLICLVPKNFAKYGMVSTFSGLLNACTYIGASVSTYGFAIIAQEFDWSVVIVCWAVLALIGTLLCLFKVKGWAKFLTK